MSRNYYAGRAGGNGNVCSFFLKGQCKFGNNCRYEHPRDRDPNRNAYAGLADQGNRNPGRGPSPRGGRRHDDPYGITEEDIELDLTKQRPIWPFSCYGPGKNAPREIIGSDKELSAEELRVMFYLDPQKAQDMASTLSQAVDQQISTILRDLRGAIRYVREAENVKDPAVNRLVALESAQSSAKPPTPMSATPTGQMSFGQPSQLGSQSSFGQPSQLGGQSAFGQPSQTPVQGAFGQPAELSIAGAFARSQSSLSSGSGSFGQPSQLGNRGTFGQLPENAQPSAFGQASSLGIQPNQFGQSSQPAGQGAFATPAGQGTFGQPSQLGGQGSFGQPSQLGATSSAFGQPTQLAVPGSVGKTSPFAAATAQPNNPSPFASAAQNQQGNSSPFLQAPSGISNGTFGQSLQSQQAQPASTSGAFGQVLQTPPQRQSNGFGNTASGQALSGGFRSSAPQVNGSAGIPSGGIAPPNALATTLSFGTSSIQPPFDSYARKTDRGNLSHWKGQPVSYIEVLKINDKPPIVDDERDAPAQSELKYVPVYQRPDTRQEERIWFDNGPQWNDKLKTDAEAQDKSVYEGDLGRTLEAIYEQAARTGSFKDGLMPEAPPKLEWIRYDI